MAKDRLLFKKAGFGVLHGLCLESCFQRIAGCRLCGGDRRGRNGHCRRLRRRGLLRLGRCVGRRRLLHVRRCCLWCGDGLLGYLEWVGFGCCCAAGCAGAEDLVDVKTFLRADLLKRPHAVAVTHGNGSFRVLGQQKRTQPPRKAITFFLMSSFLHTSSLSQNEEGV